MTKIVTELLLFTDFKIFPHLSAWPGQSICEANVPELCPHNHMANPYFHYDNKEIRFNR